MPPCRMSENAEVDDADNVVDWYVATMATTIESSSTLSLIDYEEG